MNLYSIKDNLAEECGPLFAAINDAVAVRMSKQMLSDYPSVQDMCLIKFGSFDGKTALLEKLDVPVLVSVDLSTIKEVKHAEQV